MMLEAATGAMGADVRGGLAVIVIIQCGGTRVNIPYGTGLCRPRRRIDEQAAPGWSTSRPRCWPRRCGYSLMSWYMNDDTSARMARGLEAGWVRPLSNFGHWRSLPQI